MYYIDQTVVRCCQLCYDICELFHKDLENAIDNIDKKELVGKTLRDNIDKKKFVGKTLREWRSIKLKAFSRFR